MSEKHAMYEQMQRESWRDRTTCILHILSQALMEKRVKTRAFFSGVTKSTTKRVVYVVYNPHFDLLASALY